MERIKRHIGTHHITSFKIFILILAIVIGGGVSITYSLQTYPEVFKTEITTPKISNLDFEEPFVINFSQSLPAAKFTSGITITPPEKVSYHWENSNKKLVITPVNSWQAETTYKINTPAGFSAMLTRINSRTLTFSTRNFPRVKDVSPQDGASDVAVDTESPITVDFDKSVNGFFVKFILDPSSDLTLQNNPEKTQFKMLPKDGAKDGTEYNFNVYIKKLNDSDANYKEIYTSSFRTLDPAPLTWEKDYTLRLEQAKKYTRPKITIGKYIDINLAEQILCTFEDGKLLTANMISSGKPGMPTPKGQFSIHNKFPRAWSKEFGLFMPWWMAVAPDGSFGIHELPEWPGGYKEGANHLGTPVSHGCIRLGVGPAKQIYDWADIGTPVIIY